jgi:hypothetical protein
VVAPMGELVIHWGKSVSSYWGNWWFTGGEVVAHIGRSGDSLGEKWSLILYGENRWFTGGEAVAHIGRSGGSLMRNVSSYCM